MDKLWRSDEDHDAPRAQYSIAVAGRSAAGPAGGTAAGTAHQDRTKLRIL